MITIGIRDWFSSKKSRKNDELRANVSAAVRSSVKGLQGGKQTQNKWERQFMWYDGPIRRSEYRTKDIMESLRMIRDIDPDASMAIWNFIRLGNSGHELECLKPTGKPDKQAQEILNDIAKKVGRMYGGGTDQLIGVLLLTAITQGAIALEVELTEGIDDVVDFHAIDPSTLDFKYNKEEKNMELVQRQDNGEYKVLNQEQVFYFPIDPDVNDPYGRSPILPILQIIFFQVQVLSDLQKVVHHQGHARFDISVVEEAIMKNIPPHIQGDAAAVQEYVQGYINEVQKMMSELNPDDDFFHTDSIKVDTVGGVQGKSMDITKVIDVINQRVTTALKQLPILLGRNEGTTETHGTIQWQIYVAGIENMQRGIKRLLERAYNVALQVHGKQSKARLTFNSIRVNDREKEANAENIETMTKQAQVLAGWIDNNEAAHHMVGHDAVAEPQIQTPSAPPAVERSKRRQMKKESKMRADTEEDEYVKEMDLPWSSEIAKITTEARDEMHDLLQKQLERYIDRLEEAPEVPTRMMVDIHRMPKEERILEPIIAFIEWVRNHILGDSTQEIEEWDELAYKWSEKAGLVAGEENLFEIDPEINFNFKDEKLLRWLANRAYKSAELIQGTTDEAVIMTLWDVAAEGDYTIQKFSDALQDSFEFSHTRATTIARTEVINASRSGQFHSDEQSGMVIGKEWRSARQPDRTRPGHYDANGQIQPFDKPFEVANGQGNLEKLMFPGDDSQGATASNLICCRCWYKRILQGEEDKLS
ncbi:phage head morphogenesis protein [Bacillus wiedmannii]|uniref:phage head morphogenesis protein n=1 Tax=Bacillus wiedmannii TaxID=1890302 RepID=UPI0021CFC729|nr:phage head morphogenesis protein [Bacillus wiedmannii]MCU5095036.1 phage head morphogenesis protein [Bacillus wiedmannii]